jgi:alpha-D-xyloside xylohydrolase
MKPTAPVALLLLLSGVTAPPLRAAGGTPPPALERQADGIILARGDTFLKVQVCADDIIRVASAKDRMFFTHASLIVNPRRAAPAAWQLVADGEFATLRTARLQARVDLSSGGVSFLDLEGRPILSEQPATRMLEPSEVQGAKTFHLRQAWAADPGEALYGLGQNQLGLLDIKGYDLDLWQHNGTVAVPFLVSSRGYGLLWDNNSYTRFGDLREFTPIPAARLLDADGHAGGLTASYFAGADFRRLVDRRVEQRIDIAIPDAVKLPNRDINPALPDEGGCSVRWEGFIVPDAGGVHMFESFSNCGIRLWIDGRLVMDHWRQGWLPWLEIARVPLEAGRRHALKLEWSRDEGMPTVRLRWKTPTAETATSLWSEAGDGTDYYFAYGPQLDGVIGAYRRLTGAAPMMPAWAFGLWQSRERYETAQQSLDVVKGFRSRGIPFDNIVQDWRYWPEGTWGSHEFDPARFPDPDGWIKAIHELHAHLMISVWGKFDPGTGNFSAMRDRGYLYERNLAEGTRDWLNQPYTFYDAFNPGARKLLWEQMDRQLFRRGIDAWWMDATEPDLRPTPTLDGQRDYANPTALGPGSRVLNAYPLLNSAAVYEGQRSAAPDQRVFILTRSGFAGEQRYAAAVWSGDTSSTWTAMRKQITAGLGFCISGLPYWTMDSGGFSVPSRFSARDASPADVAEWRELSTRWFEFATFVPLLRAHGQFPFREMWELGGESSPGYQAELKFDRLRYRLMPYIYSLAGAVTRQDGTIMRALVMDFAADPAARDIGDQYMFGPALLVNPVTTYQARSRSVYLPGTGVWYDFSTGAVLRGGQTVEAAAPFDTIPIYVKAGSIIPAGPEIQYTGEKPADPVTLYVYAGADGAFTVYEDDGLTYGYERGAFSLIPIRWNDATRTLVIGARTGTFPGMLAERTFDVVLVSAARPAGLSLVPAAVDQRVHYVGDQVEVVLH